MTSNRNIFHFKMIIIIIIIIIITNYYSVRG